MKFFNQEIEERLKVNGENINCIHYEVLQMLQSETSTIRILSLRTGMDPSSLVRSIDTLEQKGLVKRGRDPKDRQRNPLLITQKGSDLLVLVAAISEKDLSFQAIQTIGIESAIEVRE
ncbi:MAG: MarR family winged helix-turn-helix transcriptional regulator [Anaerolineaceae bacterium]